MSPAVFESIVGDFFFIFGRFLGLGHLRGPGVSLGRILGVPSIEPFLGEGGGSSQGLHRPRPSPTAPFMSPGEWKRYRDIVKEHGDAVFKSDEVGTDFFNSVQTIKRKTEYALREGLGGVMIWDSGLDVPTTDARSLLRAIRSAIDEFNAEHGDEL